MVKDYTNENKDEDEDKDKNKSKYDERKKNQKKRKSITTSPYSSQLTSEEITKPKPKKKPKPKTKRATTTKKCNNNDDDDDDDGGGDDHYNEEDLHEEELKMFVPKGLEDEIGDDMTNADRNLIASISKIRAKNISLGINEEGEEDPNERYDGYVIDLGEDVKKLLNQYQNEKNVKINVVTTIENCVCTFVIPVKTISRIRLALLLHSFGAQFNSKRFASVTIKLRKTRLSPSAVALIFSTGRVVLTGTRSLEAACLAAHRVMYIVRQHGKYSLARVQNLTIRNIVGCLRLGVKLNLGALASLLSGACYDPENFPGLIYRTRRIKTHFLIYDTGAIVITGAKTPEDIEEGARFIIPFCAQSFRGTKTAKQIVNSGNYTLPT